MKVIPEEIRQYTFHKAFRGYEKEAVDQYLHALSLEWQKENDEIESLKKALEISEKELNRLKDVESIMLRTIKEGDENARKLLENAEVRSAEIIESATVSGDEYYTKKKTEGDDYWAMAEAKAGKILDDTENEKIRLLNEANVSIKNLREETIMEIDSSEKEYNSLDIAKQQLIYDLKSLLENTKDRLELLNTKYDPNLFNPKRATIQSIALAKIDEKINEKTTKVKKSATIKKTDIKGLVSKTAKVKPTKTAKTSAKKVKQVKKATIDYNTEVEDDGLPTVQKILAITEIPNLPTIEVTDQAVEETSSFFDKI